MKTARELTRDLSNVTTREEIEAIIMSSDFQAYSKNAQEIILQDSLRNRMRKTTQRQPRTRGRRVRKQGKRQPSKLTGAQLLAQDKLENLGKVTYNPDDSWADWGDDDI